MLILAAAAELPVPVSDPEVGLDKCVTHWTITKHCVEERLKGRGEGKRRRERGREEGKEKEKREENEKRETGECKEEQTFEVWEG